MKFTNGSGTVYQAGADLGLRITDFVEGTGPYLEKHVLSDVMMRFATGGAYTTDGSTPAFTRSSLTVSDLKASINGGPAQTIEYSRNGTMTDSLTTTWQHVAGGNATTNPRQVEFLVIDILLSSHKDSLEMTGTLKFSWGRGRFKDQRERTDIRIETWRSRLLPGCGFIHSRAKHLLFRHALCVSP